MTTTLLQILSFCSVGYSLLLSMAITAVFVAFVRKLKKSELDETQKREAPINENENNYIRELIRINQETLQKQQKADENMGKLLVKLEEAYEKLNKLVKDQNAALVQDNLKYVNQIKELEQALEEETLKINEFANRIEELEGASQATQPCSEGKAAYEKIRELEELVSYKDEYYAEITNREKKMRTGTRDALNSLAGTRGSNSIEYLEEEIEKVIKILDDSLD